MFEDGTPSSYEYDWTRCEALVKTWPNASNLGPIGSRRRYRHTPIRTAAIGRRVATRSSSRRFCSSSFKKRTGERPTPKAVANRLGVIRVRNNPGLRAALATEHELVDDPVPDFVLAHLRAMQAAAPTQGRGAVLAQAIACATRHGRPLNPMHDLGKCEACARSRDEDRRLVEMVDRFGPNWRHKLDPEIVARGYPARNRARRAMALVA